MRKPGIGSPWLRIDIKGVRDLRKRNGFLFFSVLLLTALLLSGCGSRAEKAAEPASEPAAAGVPETGSASAEEAAEKSTAAGELRIGADGLSTDPLFIDVEEDGTAMQVIALKDGDGKVRLAFNTCQSCGGSPYAWFEDLGDGRLQCQNCHQTFPLETVGTAGSVGCSPVPITEFTVEGSVVTVPEAVLKENTGRFENWKKFD